MNRTKIRTLGIIGTVAGGTTILAGALALAGGVLTIVTSFDHRKSKAR